MYLPGDPMLKKHTAYRRKLEADNPDRVDWKHNLTPQEIADMKKRGIDPDSTSTA